MKTLRLEEKHSEIIQETDDKKTPPKEDENTSEDGQITLF